MTDWREALPPVRKALAQTMTSVPTPGPRWLIIASVSIVLVAFLLASPVILAEYAQQILSQAFFSQSPRSQSIFYGAIPAS
jgi:branched-chain amino acid transport system permease protein